MIERVVSESSQASLQRVEALRAALDSASKALEAALATPPDATIEITELVAKLTKAATTDGDARLKRLSSEARKITETLRSDLEQQTKEKEELAATLAEAQADAESVRAEFDTAQREAGQAREQLGEALAAQQALEAARQEAILGSEEEATARAAAETELLRLGYSSRKRRRSPTRTAEVNESLGPPRRRRHAPWPRAKSTPGQGRRRRKPSGAGEPARSDPGRSREGARGR